MCLRKDSVSVRRHSESLQHKDAVEKELCSSQDGGIQQAFQMQILLNKAALKTAVVASKGRIPHTLNYPSVLKAVEIMGCSQLSIVKMPNTLAGK